jgi:stage III sporulation protein AH
MISVFHINKIIKTVIAFFVCLLILLLAYSGYLVFFAKEDKETKGFETIEVSKNVEIDEEFSKTLKVLTLPSPTPDFFTEYRLERDKIRSERTDLLRDILINAKNNDAREQIQYVILQMTAEKKIESEMENLIKSKGFGDALVFVRENSVSAIVKASSLSKEEVARVADVVSRISGARAENITVSAKP